MRMSSHRIATSAFCVAMIAALGGCESLEDFNPFSEKEKILPGERHALFAGADPAGVSNAGLTASISGARDTSDWRQSGGNTANNPGNVAIGGSGARAWRVRAGSPGSAGGLDSFTNEDLRVAARPIVYGGRIFTYDPNGQVTALSLGGGRAWSVSLRPEGEDDNAAGGGIAADQGRVFAATAYGEAVALDASSGQALWTKKLRSPARSAPSAAGGKVYFVSQTNEIYALNQADGEEVWSFSGIPETGGVMSAASPAVVGDTVVFPSISGEVVAMSATKGEPRWVDVVSRSYRTKAFSGLADVAASPVVADGVVYATGISGRTLAMKLATGARIWEQNVGSVHTPIVSGNAVFMVDLDDRAVALDRRSGKPIWVTQLPKGDKDDRKIWAGPVLAGGALWFVSNEGRMISVNASNGSVVANNNIGRPTFVAPIAAAGRLFVLSGDGSLSAYQ